MSYRFNCESLYESEILQHYPTTDLLNTTADKLRWYRLKNGYLQSEIADIIGVYRSTYIHYEEPSRKFYELDKLQLLADLYKVDIECLLDDYMLFLYEGQGKQLKALRKSLGITQEKLAGLFCAPKENIKHGIQEKYFMQCDSFIKIKAFFDI